MNFISDDEVTAFRSSGEFDDRWYVEQYPDVKMLGMDPAAHFLWIGRKIGRRPSGASTLELMSDQSYENSGKVNDGRLSKREFSRAQIELVELSQFFDREYYLNQYKEVQESDLSPVMHYLLVGADLGYNPSAQFSTELYWKKYPDTQGVIPLLHYLESGEREGRRYFRVRQKSTQQYSNDPIYEQWIEDVEAPSLTDEKIQSLRQELSQQIYQPKIAVVMPVYNTPDVYLRLAIESVLNQVYENWELCIADDFSGSRDVRAILEEYKSRDERIKIVFREKNGHIAHATNSGMDLVESPWVALLDHDDILRSHALAEVVLEINRNPDSQIIYSDEDKIDESGIRYDPYFKPDFSIELFRSANYLNHLTVHRAENIRLAGRWDPDTIGSQDYDLNLRIIERVHESQIRHIPKVLYHWRAIEGSTARATDEKPVCFVNAIKALRQHAKRMQLPAEVIPLDDIGYARFRYVVPDPAPLVSLIIPTRDKVELLEACLESIFSKTTYENYEIIVLDNESIEQQTRKYFKEITLRKNVRIVPIEGAYNYSAFHNKAVPLAEGSIIGLVNNDIEVITPDWLTEMVSWAVQPRIGCVGAKLYYGDDTIQHAGVVVGMGGVAGHAHKHRSRFDNGYFGNLRLVQNMSAVTAACLLVRKHIYYEVGGMDDIHLPVAFNDVDFCLKVREAGYKCVWTPFAELYHHESKTRGYEDTPEKQARAAREIAAIKERWGDKIKKDPFYSINLSLWDEKSSYMIDV